MSSLDRLLGFWLLLWGMSWCYHLLTLTSFPPDPSASRMFLLVLPFQSLRKKRWEPSTAGWHGTLHIYYAHRCSSWKFVPGHFLPPPKPTGTLVGLRAGSTEKWKAVVKPTPKGETYQFGAKMSWKAGFEKMHTTNYPKSCLNVDFPALWYFMFIPEQRPAYVILSDQNNYPSTKSSTFLVLNKMSCVVSSNSMAYPSHHMNIQLQGVGGKRAWCIGEEQFPAARVQCSISNCVVFICTPTQLQYRKQNKQREDSSLLRSAFKKAKPRYKIQCT